MAPTSDDPNEVQTMTIVMPQWMMDDLHNRAARRGISVVELVRRATSLERMLFEHEDSIVTVTNERMGTTKTVRML